MRKLILLIVVLLTASISPAQDTLLLQEVVGLALQNNFGIRVARLSTERAELSVYTGNANLLPRIVLGGNGTYNVNDTRFQFIQRDSFAQEIGIVTVTENNLVTWNAGANLGLTYTVFDGLGNIHTFEAIKANAAAITAQNRATIQASIAQVITSYYLLARAQANNSILIEALDISRARRRYINNQREFGTGNKLAILNAEVDLNTDSANLIRSDLNLDNTRRDLNLLMGADVNRSYAVSLDIVFLELPGLDALMDEAMAYNPTLQAANYSLMVSERNLKVAKAVQYPKLDINASYGYFVTDQSTVGFLKRIETLGIAAGGSLSINIFDGNRVRRNIQDATVAIKSSEIEYTQTTETLRRDVQNAYATYLNSLELLELQQVSLQAAEANFTSSADAFRLGQINAVTFRDAQINMLQVKNRIVELTFDVKLNETEMLRLTGKLVNAGSSRY